MTRLISHLIVYAAVNAFLIAIWVLVSRGSIADVQHIAHDPASALDRGFWPIWPILGWGMLVVIHGGTTISNLLFGRSSRRRRQRMAKHALRAGQDVVKEVSGAIDKAQQRRTEREERRAARDAGRTEHHGFPVTPQGTVSDAGGSGAQRRWVTVMFSDISESTRHNEEMGDDEWHRVLGGMRALVRNAIAARGGSEVGTSGDGLLARFSSPADAVLCAVDIQDALEDKRSGEAFVPHVRIGVHAGEAVEEDGDLVGRVINLASRVTDEASPGEILVTEPVADQLVGKLELEDKGLRPLRGMAQPRHLLAVKWSDRSE